MTLAIDFGIPPKLVRSLSQEFVPWRGGIWTLAERCKSSEEF